MISQLLLVDIKITKLAKCISLFCSFPDSWVILVMTIERNNTTLKIDDVVASLLSKEMRKKNMAGSTHDSLVVRGLPVKKGKDKSSSTKSKSRGISKTRSRSSSPSTRRCLQWGKFEHYKRDYKSKGVDKSKGSKEMQLTEGNTSQEERGDVYLASISTQSNCDS